MIHKDPNKILFVIVLYKCKLEECHTYQTLLKDIESSEDLFVYDNSPMAQNTDIKVGQYIHDTNNSGLSVAYNRAAEYAKENGYTWLLLLDQDTTFPKGALREYKKAILEHPEVHMIAPKHKISTGLYISPTKYKNFISEEQSEVLDGMVSFDDACPINSGIMVDTESFFKAAGYDESVYLDFSDISFIRRFKKIVPEYYVLPNVLCLQNYSVNDIDINKVKMRFKIWLDCASHLTFENIGEKNSLIYTVFRRSFALSWFHKNISFLLLFLRFILKVL